MPSALDGTAHRVAVVGSGAAGASATHRLRTVLGPRARLTVFEREQVIGGRAHQVDFAGEQIEVGGTLIHTSNTRLADLAGEVGAVRVTPGVSQARGTSEIAVWDGERFRFRAESSGIWLPLALIRRYGPLNLLRLRRLSRQSKDKWVKVYELQDSGARFHSGEELIAALDLGDEVRHSLDELTRTRRISDRLTHEFVTGVLRNMYNQTSSIGAFAGLVGLAGAGLAGGSLFAIEGGNNTLLARVITAAEATVALGTKVTAVRADGARIHLDDAGGGTHEFDAVVIAAPLENAGLVVTGPGARSSRLDASTSASTSRSWPASPTPPSSRRSGSQPTS